MDYRVRYVSPDMYFSVEHEEYPDDYYDYKYDYRWEVQFNNGDFFEAFEIFQDAKKCIKKEQFKLITRFLQIFDRETGEIIYV